VVVGLDTFRTWFSDHGDHYVLIGGVAAHLAMAAAGLDFRVTKDLDIVLLVEALEPGFVQRFWDFVQAGKYEQREQAMLAGGTDEARRCHYRFQKPMTVRFPAMLELFSRLPDALEYSGSGGLTPVPVDGDTSSLSAILLDDAYYDLVRHHRVQRDGLSVLRTEPLILLKARAWLDLSARKAQGEAIDAKTIRKHANDVLKLVQIVAPTPQFQAPVAVLGDLEQFIDRLPVEHAVDMKTLGFATTTMPRTLANLRQVFGLLGPWP
jgi:hypothetical protein